MRKALRWSSSQFWSVSSRSKSWVSEMLSSRSDTVSSLHSFDNKPPSPAVSIVLDGRKGAESLTQSKKTGGNSYHSVGVCLRQWGKSAPKMEIFLGLAVNKKGAQWSMSCGPLVPQTDARRLPLQMGPEGTHTSWPVEPPQPHNGISSTSLSSCSRKTWLHREEMTSQRKALIPES